MANIHVIFVFSFLLALAGVDCDLKSPDQNLKNDTSTKIAIVGIGDDTNPVDIVKIPVEGQSDFVKVNASKNLFPKDKQNKESSKTVPKKGVSKSTGVDKSNSDVKGQLSDQPLDTSAKNEGQKLTQKTSMPENRNATGKSTRKRKPKPRVTIGEPGADMPIPSSPTRQSPIGTPRKMDYIIPAVITMTTLPLMGATFYILYKRGRDYWDKRHYRRMDFLINGMYNE